MHVAMASTTFSSFRRRLRQASEAWEVDQRGRNQSRCPRVGRAQSELQTLSASARPAHCLSEMTRRTDEELKPPYTGQRSAVARHSACHQARSSPVRQCRSIRACVQVAQHLQKLAVGTVRLLLLVQVREAQQHGDSKIRVRRWSRHRLPTGHLNAERSKHLQHGSAG